MTKYNFTARDYLYSGDEFIVSTGSVKGVDGNYKEALSSGNSKVQLHFERKGLDSTNFWKNLTSVEVSFGKNSIKVCPKTDYAKFIVAGKGFVYEYDRTYASYVDGELSKEFIADDRHKTFMAKIDPNLMNEVLEMFDSTELTDCLGKEVQATGEADTFDTSEIDG